MRLKYLILLLVFAVNVFAQGDADSLWMQSYGGADRDRAEALRRTQDGGYVLAGTIEQAYRGGNLCVVKTDSAGRIEWNHTFSEGDAAGAHDIQQLASGGYVIAGSLTTMAGNERTLLVKLDAHGNREWSAQFGESCSSSAYFVTELPNGNLLLAGWTESAANEHWDVNLICTDARGQLRWSRTYGGKEDEWATCVRVTRDGGYITAGRMQDRSDSRDYICILKTDDHGSLQWWQTHYAPDLNRVDAIIETDAGYFFAGSMRSEAEDAGSFSLVKTNLIGEILWNRVLDRCGSFDDRVAVQPTDQGYLVAGYSVSLGSKPRALCLMRVMDDGELRWRRAYDGLGWDRQGQKGGYWISDATESFGQGLRDLFEQSAYPDYVECRFTNDTPVPARYGRKWWQKYCFCSGAMVSFSLPIAQDVSITVVDRDGQTVQTIAKDYYIAGKHTEMVNGGLLPEGICFVLFRAGEYAQMQKIAVMK